MKAIRLLSIIYVALIISGCISTERYPWDEAASKKNAEIQMRRTKRAENVKQNWSKLQGGMSLDEVEKLIGPFQGNDDSVFINILNASTMEIKTEIYKIEFVDRRLQRWKLRKW